MSRRWTIEWVEFSFLLELPALGFVVGVAWAITGWKVYGLTGTLVGAVLGIIAYFVADEHADDWGDGDVIKLVLVLASVFALIATLLWWEQPTATP